MKYFYAFLLSIMCTIYAFGGEARTPPIYIGGGTYGGTVIVPPVKPFYEIKNKNVVRQKLDFSCGSAAVATILNYYLGIQATEDQIIQNLFKVGNLQLIMKRRGFSLLDIKRFFNLLGYKAVGYKTDLETLQKLNRPAIVTIVLGKYKHYVVFKGVKNGRVLLADPALGNMIIPAEQFNKIWYKNIALVVYSNDNKGLEALLSKEEEIWVKEDTIRNTIEAVIPTIFKAFKEF